MKPKKKPDFERMSRSEKAVAIAQDVIKQVNREVYDVTNGTYAALDVSENVESGKGCDLQQIIRRRVTKRQPCAVCAIGSAFLSGVRLFDKFKVSEDNTDGEVVTAEPMRSKLEDFFHKDDLWALESCFEVSAAYVGMDEDDKLYREWYDSCKILKTFLEELEPTERLVWLMEVIITNNGRFSYDMAKRAALVTLGGSTDGRWVNFRRLFIPTF